MVDEDLTNNVFCRNVEGEKPVLIGPDPNPASDQFTFSVLITTESSVSVELTDSRGRLVSRFMDEATLSKGLYSFTVPVDSIGEGVYFLRMRSGEVSLVKKIILE
jgi:hypothetical protein